MSKLGTAVAALGLAGVAAVGIVAIDAEVRDAPAIVLAAEDHPYRFAVASITCLEAEGITIDKVRQVCASHEAQGDYLGCVTDRVPIHKCEIPRVELPAGAFRKLVGCRCDYGDGVQDYVWLKPLSFSRPAECSACQTICPSVINSKSRRNVWAELEECLEAECAGCDIEPHDWGPCPHCLAPGRDCAAECAE